MVERACLKGGLEKRRGNGRENKWYVKNKPWGLKWKVVTLEILKMSKGTQQLRFRKFRQMMKTQAWCRKQTEVKGHVLERR